MNDLLLGINGLFGAVGTYAFVVLLFCGVVSWGIMGICGLVNKWKGK